MAIGLSSILTFAVGGQIPLLVVVQRLFVSINSFPLMAIPFFMLASTIMDRSGITQRLVNLASALVGWLKGGMCYVTVVTGMLMGGISGSATADTAALTSIMVLSMKKLGYPGPFAAALQAASGSIGIMIPPSIPMIILGSITIIFLGALFLGIFVYKSIKISDISDMFTESTLNAASVMLIIGASSLFSWILVSNGFSKQVS